MIVNLPNEILQSLFSWLPRNSDTIALNCSCRQLNKLATENGYIRKMCFNKNIDGNNWIKRYITHSRTIDNIYMESQKNPHYWIIDFPRMVNCSECELTEPFIPNGGYPCKTEILIFRNMSHKTRTNFQTNWSLFPNLRRLVIYVDECNINGLEKLINLDTAYIYTYNGVYKRDGIKGEFIFKPRLL